jgi:hypothetical protein
MIGWQLSTRKHPSVNCPPNNSPLGQFTTHMIHHQTIAHPTIPHFYDSPFRQFPFLTIPHSYTIDHSIAGLCQKLPIPIPEIFQLPLPLPNQWWDFRELGSLEWSRMVFRWVEWAPINTIYFIHFSVNKQFCPNLTIHWWRVVACGPWSCHAQFSPESPKSCFWGLVTMTALVAQVFPMYTFHLAHQCVIDARHRPRLQFVVNVKI